MAITLTACDKTDTTETVENKENSAQQITSSESIKQHAEIFAGCYTVSPDEPAQIKVSQQDQGLVMQMKEPKSAKRVWDDPEPLEPITLDKVSNYFSIDANNLDAMIARPDRVLVMAKVKQSYVNIDPTLDSEYLGFILQGANTIFKVACDNTPSEDLTDPSSPNSNVGQVTIKPAGNVADQQMTN